MAAIRSKYQEMTREKIKENIIETYDFVKKAVFQIYSDAKILKNLYFKQRRYGIGSLTLDEHQSYFFLKKDLKKFIAVIMPIYIMLFPNAVPSQFMTDSLKVSIEATRNMKITAAKQKLLEKLSPNYQFIANSEFRHKSAEEFHEYFLTQIQKDKNLDFDLNTLDSNTLIEIADFIAFEYKKGTHFLSHLICFFINIPIFFRNLAFRLMKIQRKREYFSKQYKFDYYPFENLKKKFLVKQINRYVDYLQTGEKIYLNNKSLENSTNDIFLKERGIRNKRRKLNKKEKDSLMNVFLEACQKQKNKSNYVLFTIMLGFKENS